MKREEIERRIMELARIPVSDFPSEAMVVALNKLYLAMLKCQIEDLKKKYAKKEKA